MSLVHYSLREAQEAAGIGRGTLTQPLTCSTHAQVHIHTCIIYIHIHTYIVYIHTQYTYTCIVYTYTQYYVV